MAAMDTLMYIKKSNAHLFISYFSIFIVASSCISNSPMITKKKGSASAIFPSEEEIYLAEKFGIYNYEDLLNKAAEGKDGDIENYVRLILDENIPWDGAAAELGLRNLLIVIERNGDSKFSDTIGQSLDKNELRKLHNLIFQLIDSDLNKKFPKTFSVTNK